jgi:hypothetical protein
MKKEEGKHHLIRPYREAYVFSESEEKAKESLKNILEEINKESIGEKESIENFILDSELPVKEGNIILT